MRRIPEWQSAWNRLQYSNRYYRFSPSRLLRDYRDKFEDGWNKKELLLISGPAKILFYAGLPPLAGYFACQYAGIKTKNIPQILDRAKERAQTKLKAVEEGAKEIAQTNLKAIEERADEIAQTKLKPVEERAKEMAQTKLKAVKERAKEIAQTKLKEFKEGAEAVEERAKEIAQRKIKAVEERAKGIANTIKNAAPASNSKVLVAREELEKLVEERAKEIVRMELKSAQEKQELGVKEKLGRKGMETATVKTSNLELTMMKERLDKLEMAPKSNWEDEVVYYSIVGACLWMVLSKFLN